MSITILAILQTVQILLKINIKDVYYVYDNVRILDSLKRLNTINKYNIHYSLGSVRLFNEINILINKSDSKYCYIVAKKSNIIL